MHVPCSLPPWNHMSYCLVILFLLQRQQKNKRWCTGKGSERIVWVPGQQSRLQVSSQFKKRRFPALFCAEMALKTWNNVNRLKWRKGASEMMSAWQQTESKSITEGRQVHGGTPTHSCSYLFREVKRKSWKISLSLTISLAIAQPIACWQSRDVEDRERVSQLFHFNSEEYLYLAG